jgi:hypothetical protein
MFSVPRTYIHAPRYVRFGLVMLCYGHTCKSINIIFNKSPRILSMDMVSARFSMQYNKKLSNCWPFFAERKGTTTKYVSRKSDCFRLNLRKRADILI